MSLDPATVRRLARLARIGIEEDELAPLGAQLSGIFSWIEQLREVDVDGVPPMIATSAARMTMRDDEVTDGERVEDVLANAPERHGPYFTVPKVVE